MLSGLRQLGLDIQEGGKHTKAECKENGKKTTIPRKNDIKREITDSICKFLLAKDFDEEKILNVLK